RPEAPQAASRRRVKRFHQKSPLRSERRTEAYRSAGTAPTQTNRGETIMRLKHLAVALAIATAAPIAVATAQAEDGIFIPLFTYRTGAFAGSGIPTGNGEADYLNMLNERDGGIGGVRLIVEECETGYDTKKGVECYDSVKGRNPAVITPNATGITLQLIPKATVDKIPVLSFAYGLSASADGNLFPWIFN